MKILTLLSLAILGNVSAQDSSLTSPLATGLDLVSEMNQLQQSLTNLQSLLSNPSVQNDAVVMDKAAKLFRRARWLVYATHADTHENLKSSEKRKERERRVKERDAIRMEREMREEVRQEEKEEGEIEAMARRDMERKAALRGGNAGDGREEMRALQGKVLEDDVARSLYDTTITFPECKELFLADCLSLISTELASLAMDCDVIIHEKRTIDQEGYNKVVIVTNLEADKVLGRNNDGIVSYPFMWDDAESGLRVIGVDGKFDCQNHTPEECCETIKSSVPNADTKGNYIQCHIFVPFGGAGNKKRTDRVFVNLSLDGRVHESPVVQ